MPVVLSVNSGLNSRARYSEVTVALPGQRNPNCSSALYETSSLSFFRFVLVYCDYEPGHSHSRFYILQSLSLSGFEKRFLQTLKAEFGW
jgi:hypothetical protein